MSFLPLYHSLLAVLPLVVFYFSLLPPLHSCHSHTHRHRHRHHPNKLRFHAISRRSSHTAPRFYSIYPRHVPVDRPIHSLARPFPSSDVSYDTRRLLLARVPIHQLDRAEDVDLIGIHYLSIRHHLIQYPMGTLEIEHDLRNVECRTMYSNRRGR